MANVKFEIKLFSDEIEQESLFIEEKPFTQSM